VSDETMKRLEARAIRTDVSALYIDPRGPYPKLVADCWDELRDARNYVGPNPVVAHPPCGPWGRLRHLYEGQDRDCAIRALEHVRCYGGVLEHPAGSKLWEHDPALARHIGRFGAHMDSFGGRCISVDQVEWGHVARKRTWLYLVNVNLHTSVPPYPGRAPTHWLSGGRTPSSRRGSPVPPGIKVCSAQQRRRTPILFAEWLVSLAADAEGS
jgi:hypothetical protein